MSDEELQRTLGRMLSRIEEMERRMNRADANWKILVLGSMSFLGCIAGLYLKEKGLW